MIADFVFAGVGPAPSAELAALAHPAFGVVPCVRRSLRFCALSLQVRFCAQVLRFVLAGALLCAGVVPCAFLPPSVHLLFTHVAGLTR